MRSPALITPKITIQWATACLARPSVRAIKQWVHCVLTAHTTMQDLTVRLVDVPEMSTLNLQYRGKSGPTNVLSFPFDAPDCCETTYLGDIVLCAPVVLEEASTMQKPYLSHYAHLTIHGVLHLLGYDHLQEEEAVVMEAEEVRLLGQLGIPSPY